MIRDALMAFVVGCIVAIPMGLFIYALIGMVMLYCGITSCPEPRHW